MPRSDDHGVAILAPMSGAAGIWGPSCIASAQLAVEEINSEDALQGSILRPLFLDSDDSNSSALEPELVSLIEEGSISAIVGMTVSSVRQRLIKLVQGTVPFVYTPLYEGNEHSPNVFAIGETPEGQLAPAIRYLSKNLRVRRWALIGNDYVWPRMTHHFSKQEIANCAGKVVMERYLPFGFSQAAQPVEEIAQSNADIALLSLVGQDAVDFNRAFGESGLDRSCFRFSTAIDENVLMAIGEENTRRMFVASGYFSNLTTDINEEFLDRYQSFCQGRPPQINTLGQSLYEGLHFYAALHRRDTDSGVNGPLRYRSARHGKFYSNKRNELPVYLARADGIRFEILNQLA